MAEIPSFTSLKFATNASFSLFRNNPEVDIYRPVYDAITSTEPKEPLNREEAILPAFIEIANERNIVMPTRDTLRPYWLPDKEYDVVEIFGTLVQHVDYHRSPLPKTTSPPESDVQEYINRILSKEGKVTLLQQLEELLGMTNNNLLHAVNLGFISSRLMARSLDARAYPNIHVGQEEMLTWNDKIAQFETYGESNLSDGPGDTYYFWTHMFGALFYKYYEGMGKRTYDLAFQHGTPMMKFVRKWFAQTPITSDHYEASLLGRNIGLAFAELAEYQEALNNVEYQASLDAMEGISEVDVASTTEGVANTAFNYLFRNREHAVYQRPDQYEHEARSRIRRRDNLARGVADIVEATSSESEDKKILEIGAGTEILSLELARRGYEVTALDLYQEPLETLQQKAMTENLTAQVTPIQADMNGIIDEGLKKFEDSSFNKVVSLRATRYIEDFEAWLSEVFRVLEPNGVLVLPVFPLMDAVPWKRHSNKKLKQETSVRGMTARVRDAGFVIDEELSRKYEKVVDLDRGQRKVPFYYKPTFIVAKKP